MKPLNTLLSEVASCRICEPGLPLGANPVLQCSASAKILIAGQAPGSKVHASGIPFDDPSGDRLRDWMGISRETFYNAAEIAILPMGFCYPGTGKSGDLPPRPECARQWRASLLAQMKQIELTLVMGQYAQRYHFDPGSASLTELVKSWRDYWPAMIPLPHPSPRNNRWLKTNPWFEAEVLPELKTRIKQVLKGQIDDR
ncbi:MAG: uracil-DNA glycosylase family protein [Gammaproteobacteria bacterium]|nr:uracil-DNA glycosylase family protein [Gammaproteobacteria bacterium]